MEIAEVEIHEFTYELEDVGTASGHQVYAPGETLEPPGFVLTIRTTDGLEGHYRGFSFVKPTLAQVEMAAVELVGRDPLEREGIWQDLWTGFRHTDHLGTGPIDVALWDLAGKHYGASIAELLGGFRDSIPAYASTYFADDAPDGLDGPEAFAAFAEECRDRGYPAFKLHGHPEGDPNGDIELCRAVADAVGEEMDLMLDPASEYDTYADALRVGRALDDLDFFWYEDPLAETGQSVQMNRRLARDLDTPILGLEHVRTGVFGTVDHLVAEAADLVRADVHQDGGITGAMKIATAAEGFGTDVEFHVGGPATLHCLAAVRNTSYFEHALVHPQGIDWMADQALDYAEEIDSDGAVAVPDGPGLGVDVDWEFVERRLVERRVVDGSETSGLS